MGDRTEYEKQRWIKRKNSVKELTNPFIDLYEIVPPGTEFKLAKTVINNASPIYIVCSNGDILSHRKSGVNKINQETSNCDYKRVRLSLSNKSFKKVSVHRLVLQAFNPINDFDKFQCNHKDGNKSNNDINNLEWNTPSENIIHSYSTNLHKRKLSKDKVLQIKEDLINTKLTYEEIAKKNNISYDDVRGIVRGQYSDYTDNYKFKPRR